VHVANDAHICSICSFVASFNCLNLKINIICAGVKKYIKPSYCSHFGPRLYRPMLPIDGDRKDEQFELFLGKNNMSRVLQFRECRLSGVVDSTECHVIEL